VDHSGPWHATREIISHFGVSLWVPSTDRWSPSILSRAWSLSEQEKIRSLKDWPIWKFRAGINNKCSYEANKLTYLAHIFMPILYRRISRLILYSRYAAIELIITNREFRSFPSSFFSPSFSSFAWSCDKLRKRDFRYDDYRALHLFFFSNIERKAITFPNLFSLASSRYIGNKSEGDLLSVIGGIFIFCLIIDFSSFTHAAIYVHVRICRPSSAREIVGSLALQDGRFIVWLKKVNRTFW